MATVSGAAEKPGSKILVVMRGAAPSQPSTDSYVSFLGGREVVHVPVNNKVQRSFVHPQVIPQLEFLMDRIKDFVIFVFAKLPRECKDFPVRAYFKERANQEWCQKHPDQNFECSFFYVDRTSSPRVSSAGEPNNPPTSATTPRVAESSESPIAPGTSPRFVLKRPQSARKLTGGHDPISEPAEPITWIQELIDANYKDGQRLTIKEREEWKNFFLALSGHLHGNLTDEKRQLVSTFRSYLHICSLTYDPTTNNTNRTPDGSLAASVCSYLKEKVIWIRSTNKLDEEKDTWKILSENEIKFLILGILERLYAHSNFAGIQSTTIAHIKTLLKRLNLEDSEMRRSSSGIGKIPDPKSVIESLRSYDEVTKKLTPKELRDLEDHLYILNTLLTPLFDQLQELYNLLKIYRKRLEMKILDLKTKYETSQRRQPDLESSIDDATTCYIAIPELMRATSDLIPFTEAIRKKSKVRVEDRNG